MGQRSQIYIRYRDEGNNTPADGSKGIHLVALYFQWCFGERMVSRARHTIEWAKESAKYYWELDRKVGRIAEVNFDMGDIVLSHNIIKETIEDFQPDTVEEFNDCVFNQQDNNDGQLYIDVFPDGTVKHCFTRYPMTTDKLSNNVPITATQYMTWDYKGWRKAENKKNYLAYTNRNIKWLKENSPLMTAEELAEFKTCTEYFDKALKEYNAIPF